jgi:chromosomal replication initiation ATPase DnaA
MASAKFKISPQPEPVREDPRPIGLDRAIIEHRRQISLHERAVREQRRRQLLDRVERARMAGSVDDCPKPRIVPVKDLLAKFCLDHDITFAELCSLRRPRHLVALRDEAIRIVADSRPDLSTPQIGRIFGGRDHTTILYALRKTKKESGR